MPRNVFTATSKSHSRLGLIFMGPHGIRSGWRVLLFLAILITVEGLPAIILRYVVPQVHIWVNSQPKTVMNPGFMLFKESWLTLFLLIAVFLMSRIERRSFSYYGLPLRPAFGRKFLRGLAIGLCAVSLLMALIAAVGGYSLGTPLLGVGGTLKYGLVWAVILLLAGISEEVMFRGYLQVTLTSGIGFWPAAVLVSLGFAAVHIANSGEKWPGIVMVFCYAMFACYTLQVFGDLWFIIGLHAAWDWAHAFLFSVPIAGYQVNGKLLRSSLHGPQWLTGGTVGPDGSVFAFVVLFALFVLISRAFSRRATHHVS